MEKLKQKELEILNEYFNKSKEQKELISTAEIEILRFQEAKLEAFKKLKEFNSSLQKELDKLNDKYGPININLKDGSYEKIEKD